MLLEYDIIIVGILPCSELLISKIEVKMHKTAVEITSIEVSLIFVSCETATIDSLATVSCTLTAHSKHGVT
jgi:hypothetical protein